MLRTARIVGLPRSCAAPGLGSLGSGLDDPRFAEDVSRLVGDHDVTVRSYSHGDGRSSSTSLRQQRILSAAAIRALPKGTGLLLATGCKAASIVLQPWFSGPQAREVAEAQRQAAAGVTAGAAVVVGRG